MSGLRLTQVAAPASPPSGKAELFYDVADGLIKVKSSSGTVMPLQQTKDYNWFRQAGTSPLEGWYAAGCVSAAATTTVSVARDVLRAFPFFSGRGGTIDRLAIDVTIAGTVTVGTGKARLGIYTSTSDSNLYPDALVLDAGEVVVTTSGNKAITVSQILKANTLYWLVMNHDCDLTAPTFRALSAGQQYAIFGLGPPGWGADSATHITKALTYAALPTSYPASGSIGTSIFPIEAVRYSA